MVLKSMNLAQCVPCRAVVEEMRIQRGTTMFNQRHAKAINHNMVGAHVPNKTRRPQPDQPHRGHRLAAQIQWLIDIRLHQPHRGLVGIGLCLKI
ncbi:hypothetical protein D3C80_1137260 [compost metagenome]